MEKTDIKSLSLEELKSLAVSMGEKPFRGRQLYEWMHKKLACDYEEMTNLSKELREKLQKELIKSGIIALKSGGIMCYSTCTLNKVENENIIKWAKDNFNIELLDIDLKIKNSIKVMKKALKILPNKL